LLLTMETMEGFFHLYSEGKLTPDLNISEKDFARNSNNIAISSHLSVANVLGYSVVDSHVHTLLKNRIEVVEMFADTFQNRMWHQGCSNFNLRIVKVDNEDYLKIVGSYVICQATKDGKQVMPYDYRWSSASLYFRTIPVDTLWLNDDAGNKLEIKTFSELGARQRLSLHNTKQPLPGEWRICTENGLILPSSFVSIGEFESIYKTYNTFRTFMGTNKKHDREVARAMCQDLYSTFDIKSLDLTKRITLARAIKDKYRMGTAQLSRRVYLPEEELKRNVR